MELLRNLSENSYIGIFASSYILAETELLYCRVYITDNRKITDEKTTAKGRRDSGNAEGGEDKHGSNDDNSRKAGEMTE